MIGLKAKSSLRAMSLRGGVMSGVTNSWSHDQSHDQSHDTQVIGHMEVT